MTKFRKNLNCPTSQTLLSYQKRETAARDRDRILVHLRFCEFCASEVEFYTHYPQSEEITDACADIPRPLFELAEALLSNRHNEYLDRLIPEKDPVNA